MVYVDMEFLGFRVKLRGTRYLRDILEDLLEAEPWPIPTCGSMYARVAERYEVTPGSVERDIRTAREDWEGSALRDPEHFSHIMHRWPGAGLRGTGNREAIVYLYEWLKD